MFRNLVCYLLCLIAVGCSPQFSPVNPNATQPSASPTVTIKVVSEGSLNVGGTVDVSAKPVASAERCACGCDCPHCRDCSVVSTAHPGPLKSANALPRKSRSKITILVADPRVMVCSGCDAAKDAVRAAKNLPVDIDFKTSSATPSGWFPHATWRSSDGRVNDWTPPTHVWDATSLQQLLTTWQQSQ